MTVRQALYFIIAVAVVITIIITIVEHSNKSHPPRRAHADRNTGAAAAVLQRFAVRHGCRVLGPLTFVQGEKAVRLDAVLVGWFGVLGVLALGYNGQVYGDPRKDEWLWVSANKRESFANPQQQCALAARLMREALMKAGVRTPTTEAVYVFTAPKVELLIPRDTPAMRPKDLRAYLRKDKFFEDRGFDLEAMCAALQPYAAEGRRHTDFPL